MSQLLHQCAHLRELQDVRMYLHHECRLCCSISIVQTVVVPAFK